MGFSPGSVELFRMTAGSRQVQRRRCPYDARAYPMEAVEHAPLSHYAPGPALLGH